MLSIAKNIGLVQDKVKSTGITSTQTTDVKLEKGFLNGVNLSLQTGVGDSTITVKYNPIEGKPVYLLQNFSLAYLQMLSDQNNGHSLVTTRAMQEIINSVNELASEGTDIENQLSANLNTFAGRAYKTSIDIPLGNIYLDPSSLEIEINWKYSDAPVNRTVHISRYETERKPFELFVYSVSKEKTETFEDVRGIYALCTANYDSTKDAFFQVSDQFSNQDDSFEGFHQSTLVGSRYESAPIGEVPAKIYQTVNPIPQKVDVEITGSESDEVMLLVIQEHVIPSEVSSNTRNEAQRMALSLAKLEQTNPDKARAYRHKLGLPKSAELLQAVQRAD